MANWRGLGEASEDRMGRTAGRSVWAGRTARRIQSAGRPKRIETDRLGRLFGLALWRCPKSISTRWRLPGQNPALVSTGWMKLSDWGGPVS
jgi:hypothetical protein